MILLVSFALDIGMAGWHFLALSGVLVIRGWDEGIKGMTVEEHRKLFVPSHLAYGEVGSPPEIPRNADLVFEVHLKSILP